jgi:hypothetical protein
MSVQAHHSIAAEYDNSKQVNIDTVIQRVHFVNPHPFLIATISDGKGGAQEWRLEMDNLRELVEIGFTNLTLKPGDRVIVTGSPGRTQPNNLYIRKLERPVDGFLYQQVGSRPSIGSTARPPR